MKITKLEKKKRLFQMETDTQIVLYITEDTLVHFMLSKGKEISEKELEEIQTYAQFSYGKDLALYYISFKQRTKKEVQDYLDKHEIDSEAIKKIITSLQADKWLDDHAYAEYYIKKNSYNGDKGPRILVQKLKEKGIPQTITQDLLEQEDFDVLLNKLAKKLIKKYQNKLPHHALIEKISQTLYHKGFNSSQIKQLITSLDINQDHETEVELLYKQIEKLLPRYQKKYDGYKLKQMVTQALARKGFDFDTINSALREYL